MVAISSSSSARAYASQSVSYNCGRTIYYGDDGWFTHFMDCDGAYAYCVQPRSKVPANGSYQKDALSQTNSSTNNIRALLWFGYGGPGFDRNMWPQYYSDGSIMHDDLYYVLTHVILTNYYSYEDASTSLKGLSQSERRWLSANIMPLDDASFGFGSGNDDTFAGRCFARSAEVPETFECFSINSGKPTQTIISFTATGDANVVKVSSDHSISDFNPLYSMRGITYDIFADPSCSTLKGSVELDAQGNSNTFTASKGTYYMRERQSSCEMTGYAYDPTVYEVRIEAGTTTTLRVSDPPQYAKPEILISKLDAESLEQHPLGAASLEGALFRVKFYGGNFDSVEAAENSGALLRSWLMSTDENGNVIFDLDHMVSGDDPYLDGSGQMILPLGTVLIKEEAAPSGYLLNDSSTYICKISPTGTDTIVTPPAPSQHPNQVKRGDIEFVKASEVDMSRLANVAFRLTSTTTGESHILVTDENGYFNSSSNWNPHTYNTNENDSAEENERQNDRGIWFGGYGEGQITEPNDDLGALPYDTYDLEELRCRANENCELIAIKNISVKRDGVCVDLGTIDDPIKQTQYISSRAYDGIDLDKTFTRNSNAKLIDAIEFTNLIPGDTYTLETRLVYGSSGNDVYSNGSPVTAKRSFVAQSSNGKTNVEVSFSTAALESDSVVFFETLYKDGALLAQDCDLTNPDQTLYLEEPNLKTYAFDPTDDDKTISADRNSMIVDRVSYTNLVANETYTLVGELMVSTKNDDGTISVKAATDSDDLPISSRIDFTTQDTDGKVDMSFQFDGMLFDDGVDLVIFEKLYQADALICEHSDAADADQTVKLNHPMIDSFAFDEQSKTKACPIDAVIHIEDAITYDWLIVGGTYTLIGVLIDPKTGLAYGSDNDEALLGDVTPISDAYLDLLPEDLRSAPFKATTEFCPETSSGAVSVGFTVTDPSLASDEVENIVVYEYLIHNNEIIAEHADASDLDQMVALANPAIHTEALDKASEGHDIAALSARSVVDTIFYENLIAGKEYLVRGRLMDKASGEPLVANGKQIDGETLFTPNFTTGQTEVHFELDANDLDGREFVVFEELYKDNVLVAQHTDMQSELQTIRVTNVEGSPLPQTGDMITSTNALIVATISMMLIGLIAHRMRKKCVVAIANITSPAKSKHERLIDSLYR